MSVKPSLGITCTVHESYVTPRSSGKNLLLSLEIENLCSVCAMCLHTYMCNVFSLSLSCVYVHMYVCMYAYFKFLCVVVCKQADCEIHNIVHDCGVRRCVWNLTS